MLKICRVGLHLYTELLYAIFPTLLLSISSTTQTMRIDKASSPSPCTQTNSVILLYYHILHVRAIPTYRVYRLYDEKVWTPSGHDGVVRYFASLPASSYKHYVSSSTDKCDFAWNDKTNGQIHLFTEILRENCLHTLKHHGVVTLALRSIIQ